MDVVRRMYLLTSWWLLIAQLDESINQNVFLSSVTQAASAVSSLAAAQYYTVPGLRQAVAISCIVLIICIKSLQIMSILLKAKSVDSNR